VRDLLPHPRWSIGVVDTTSEEPAATAARLVEWFERRREELRSGTLALSGAWARLSDFAVTITIPR